MMFFVHNLVTYAPKNKACQELCEYVDRYKYVLIKDEISLDALKEEIRMRVEQINAAHPKLKQIHVSLDSSRIDASIDKGGCPDLVFFMDICKVRSVYQFSEKANVAGKGVLQ